MGVRACAAVSIGSLSEDARVHLPGRDRQDWPCTPGHSMFLSSLRGAPGYYICCNVVRVVPPFGVV
jgi:hypothetical protein